MNTEEADVNPDSAQAGTVRRSLALHARDNVANALEPLAAGDRTSAGGGLIAILEAIPLGHKFATADLAAGADIIKYGESIGKASRDIRCGELVHAHNVRTLMSDWKAARAAADGTR
jgi:altronate hydrolase